jgi:hypothetical protein
MAVAGVEQRLGRIVLWCRVPAFDPAASLKAARANPF